MSLFFCCFSTSLFMGPIFVGKKEDSKHLEILGEGNCQTNSWPNRKYGRKRKKYFIWDAKTRSEARMQSWQITLPPITMAVENGPRKETI